MLSASSQPFCPSPSKVKEQDNKELLRKPIFLENNWSFWFDRYAGPGLTVEQYAASLRHLGSFDTVQGFWKWYNNLPPIKKLGPKTSYHLMKAKIRPLWEDLDNIDGGTFSIKISKRDTDSAWLTIVLAVIGEQFFFQLLKKTMIFVEFLFLLEEMIISLIYGTKIQNKLILLNVLLL